jgi:hypothetical protein
MEKEKQGVFVCGNINSKEEYNTKNGPGYTLHVSVLGMRDNVPINVDAEKYHKTDEGSVFKSAIKIINTKWGVRFATA